VILAKKRGFICMDSLFLGDNIYEILLNVFSINKNN